MIARDRVARAWWSAAAAPIVGAVVLTATVSTAESGLASNDPSPLTLTSGTRGGPAGQSCACAEIAEAVSSVRIIAKRNTMYLPINGQHELPPGRTVSSHLGAIT